MSPDEEAAVQAACRAVLAHRRREGGRGRPPSHSAADVLEERLELDWSRFDSRGYRLLRRVAERAGFTGRVHPSPDERNPSGANFEERYSPARRRIERARA